MSKAQNFLNKNGVSGEVIVADNGSTDGSIEIALRLNARVVNVAVRGYGAALAAGDRSSERKIYHHGRFG
jgi:glycosyltransferase involved in cell wall biosynthesis